MTTDSVCQCMFRSPNRHYCRLFMFSLCVPRSTRGVKRERRHELRNTTSQISWNELLWDCARNWFIASLWWARFTGESHEGLEADSNKLYIGTSKEKCLVFQTQLAASKNWSRLLSTSQHNSCGMIMDYVCDALMQFLGCRFVFLDKCVIFIIIHYLIRYICILPFLVWYLTGRWTISSISWFCLQHWLWTLVPLWDSPATKQQLEENI